MLRNRPLEVRRGVLLGVARERVVHLAPAPLAVRAPRPDVLRVEELVWRADERGQVDLGRVDRVQRRERARGRRVGVQGEGDLVLDGGC